MYTVFFISFIISSTCFGCYLHPSSGAQLQCTAIGLYLWKTEVLVSSGLEVYLVWICVYSFFKVLCDMYVLVCVSLDLF
jgi:hypothetical protein